jgi:hypothetical protein
MYELKEHRQCRNQLIVITAVLFVLGVAFNIGELIAFDAVFGLLALFNIYTYKENLKDDNRLKSRK